MGFLDFFNKEMNPYSEFDKANHFLPQIDLASFYKLDGFDLCWLLLHPVNTIMDSEDEVSTTRRLSPAQKALHFFWYLDAQVTNGGFVQFYYNGYAKYVPAILEGLQHFGAIEMISIVRQAHGIYKKKKHLLNVGQELFGSDLYDQFDDLTELDHAYNEINHKVIDQLAIYIKSNPDQFGIDQNGNPINPTLTGLVNTTFENGQLESSFYVEGGVLSGECKEFYNNGSIKEALNYYNGVLTGIQEYFNEEGNVIKKEIIDIESNKKVVEVYSPNGTKIKEDHYDLNDSRNGISREWFDNGQLKEESYFINKYDRQGKLVRYFQNGQLYVNSEYIDGFWYIYGVWDEEGNQTLKDGTGILKSTYKDSLYVSQYLNHKHHGHFQIFTKGKLTQEYYYEHGVQEGESISYYPNGKLKSKAVYKEGKNIKEVEFPMFEKAKVDLEIKCTAKSDFFEHLNIPKPDNYPKVLNAESVAAMYQFPRALFDGYPDDFEMRYNYYLTISETGDITNSEVIRMDNARVKDAVDDAIMELRFESATLNGSPVASMVYCQFIFTLSESLSEN